MKKATLLLIGVIYIASIVVVSIFGLRAVVYDAVIPVVKIECINQTKGKVQIEDYDDKIKIIYVEYEGPFNMADNSGTKFQLEYRVLPDNATKKDVIFEYDRENHPQTTMFTNEIGQETGLMLFTGPDLVTLTIKSNDGTSVNTKVIISVQEF